MRRCTYCHIDISISDFGRHVSKCRDEHILPRSSPEDSHNYIERHVQRSTQIAGKQSLRSFWEENAVFDDAVEDRMDDWSDLLFTSREHHEDVCPICLCSTQNRWVRKLHACSHIFCDMCIRTWCEHKPVCPVCKKPL